MPLPTEDFVCACTRHDASSGPAHDTAHAAKCQAAGPVWNLPAVFLRLDVDCRAMTMSITLEDFWFMIAHEG